MKLPARQPFYATLIAATLTVLAVWFLGLRQDWSLFKSSIITLSILSSAFLSFVTVSLYEGIWLHNNFGNLLDHFRRMPFPDDLPDIGLPDWNIELDADEGCVAIVVGIIVWLLAATVAVLLLWVFAAVVWAVFLVFAAMLYWIFFRALRLILRHSRTCRGNFGLSLRYGLTYTALYTFWLYGVVLAAHFLI